MANSFVGTPPLWIIDTASSTAVSTDWIRVKEIIWVPGTAAVAGDEATVQDSAGHTFFDAFASGANEDYFPVTYPDKSFKVNGLKVPTLGHGKIYIYLA